MPSRIAHQVLGVVPPRVRTRRKALNPRQSRKKQAYRPPGARGGSGGYAGGGLTALQQQLRSELGSTSAGPQSSSATKVTGQPVQVVQQHIPGLAPTAADAASASSRNARKKKAKEAKEAAEEAAKKEALAAALKAAQAGPDLPPSVGQKSETTAPPAAEKEAPAGDGDADNEKKIRALKKKLRDIEKLKEKPPGSLDTLQKQKINGEAELLQQLEELGGEL